MSQGHRNWLKEISTDIWGNLSTKKNNDNNELPHSDKRETNEACLNS